ncbi:MAG TPA: UDP-N-acetylmuramoyl-L-alanyl-D-glutamate--2,6-diaminopimelate ligase [Acidimicrobiales bacterium]|nr:UDP-N-acetylmuramoyl-L-alanyl-D-glutamate--2,6-diaminopimelate ligase [Acidimicrobiales bacterium]
MRLHRLLGAIAAPDVRGDDVEVLDVTHDSRDVRPGSLYCCLPGVRRDGHEFAADAVADGAVALLVERLVDDVDPSVPQVRVADARAAMAPLAAEVHGHPSRALQVVGVTGTNGKTTTTYLVRAILEAAGRPTGVLGTMSASRTTPEAPVLQRTLAAFLADGKAAAAVEVSSMGLVQRRVDATWFSAAIFTNLSQDHLDDHGTMEAYFEAKASLFTPERTAVAVVNTDDEHGRVLLERAPVPMLPYSLQDAADLSAGVGASTFVWDGELVRLPLDGAYNVSNALAAATACRALGVSAADVASGLSRVGVVAGHGEAVDAGQDFRVVVDYAHTPLALESVLQAARSAAGDRGRVLVVFGCGGRRDPSKRAPMGWAASSVADVVVVTSDNPRDEDPEAIIAAITAGATGGAQVLVEPDRRGAIAIAFARANAGDVVVIAGKGHETGQEIGGEVHPFDDKDVATQLLGASRRSAQ